MERTHLTLTVHGVGCASSAHVVERRLGQVAGVMEAYVNPVFRVATIEYDAERCSAEDLVAAIESLGYASAPASRRVTPRAPEAVSPEPEGDHDVG